MISQRRKRTAIEVLGCLKLFLGIIKLEPHGQAISPILRRSLSVIFIVKGFGNLITDFASQLINIWTIF